MHVCSVVTKRLVESDNWSCIEITSCLYKMRRSYGCDWQTSVFLDVTPCNTLRKFLMFWRNLLPWSLKLGMTGLSQMLVNFWYTARQHIQEDGYWQLFVQFWNTCHLLCYDLGARQSIATSVPCYSLMSNIFNKVTYFCSSNGTWYVCI